MGMGSIIPAVLFLVGMGAIFASGGAMLFMLVGDGLIALAGLSFVKFAK